VLVDSGGPRARRQRLDPAPDGMFDGVLADAAAGTRYAYLLDGDGPYPDPASRFQPDGVHGPSMVVDPHLYPWSDSEWTGVSLNESIIYELHVGTFTLEGTFAAVASRLEYLRHLGVTTVELMPVADFPGSRNWGYDGASLFAPARCYGTPDDLRRLVDTAHRLRLAVLLDVVYNHFGPDGAYLAQFSRYYLSDRHHTPWGAAVNLDGPHAGPARLFFIENALHWLHEYHFDGLRLDATHALMDDSPRHFLRELRDRVDASIPDRTVLLVAEDDRNLATIVRRPSEGGWGLDAVWADDFHHQARRLAAGDRDGYFQDFSGSAADLATTIRQGWFYTGQSSTYRGRPSGSDPAGLPPERMVICLQNHDQVGNRALGERLNQQIDVALFRALSALLLFAPETPLLFMGQEWAADTPFLYFTDHQAELGRLVTKGRREEFAKFSAFADEDMRTAIPDPQAPSTFAASRLDWSELDRAPHAGVMNLYRALLRVRRDEPALHAPGGRFAVEALDERSLALVRTSASGDALLLVIRFSGAGALDVSACDAVGSGSRWRLLLTTEDAGFASAPAPPVVDLGGSRVHVRFERPSAVILLKV
jgi:maltooligosyltrehalose trehalohydrolase